MARCKTASSGPVVATLLLLLVAVLAISFAPEQANAQEALTLSHHSIGTVEQHATMQYSLAAPPPLTPSMELVFVVTSYSGDADLYVSNSPNAGPENYIWNSSVASMDAVIIRHDDPYYQTGTTFYVGVYGFTDASFTILAYLSNGENIVLTDGLPQVAMHAIGEYTYFTYSLIGAENFTITVTPISGDPDLYVSTSNQKPTKEAGGHTWSARDYGFDMIDITTADPNFVRDSNYYIGVYAYRETQFAITVTRWSGITTLLEGVPLSEDVQTGAYMFYKFKLSTRRTLTFTCTPLSTNGDPDLFASRLNERPTQEDHTWSSMTAGIDTIVIKPDDPHYDLGWYYLGVKGFRSSLYQLVASTEGSSITLVDGVPQSDFGAMGTYNYYKFNHNDPDADLTFTISIKQGSANMFMSRTVTNPQNSPGKYDRAAFNIGNQGIIHMSAPVPVGFYYLSVEPLMTGLVNYTIMATSNTTMQVLQEGIPIFFNTVPQGAYRYFVYDFNPAFPGHELTVTVRSTMGDADLYMHTDPNVRPSKDNYIWRSLRTDSDSITIPPSDPHYITGKYFIAVYGHTRAVFTIVAYRGNGSVEIPEGMPVPGYVDADAYVYYKFYLTARGSLTVAAQPATTSSGDPDLYMSTVTTKPNKHDHQWKSVNFGGDFITLSDTNAGWYYIAVYGASSVGTSFTITATHDFSYLFQGYTVTDTAVKDHYKRYQFLVPPNAESAMISLTLIDGATEMYLYTQNHNGKYPTRTDFDFSSTTYPGNTIMVPNTHPRWHGGSWFISVYATEESDYFMDAALDYAAIRSGIPQLGQASNRHPARYRLWVPSDPSGHPPQDYRVALDVAVGQVTLVVSQRGFPTLMNYTWRVEGTDLLELDFLKHEVTTATYLYFSVFAKNDDDSTSIFMLTAAGKKEHFYLLQQQTIEQTVDPEEESYFMVLGVRKATEARIWVDSCDLHPAPTFYVSTTNQFPDPKSDTSSKPLGLFTQYYSGTTAPGNWTYLNVKGGTSGNQFSIKSTTTVDFTPKPFNDGIIEGSQTDGEHYTIKFGGVAAHHMPLVFNIYYAEVPHGSDYSTINMYTMCGVSSYGTLLTSMTISNPDDNTELSYTFVVDPSKRYLVNIIVQDGLGVDGVYSPHLAEPSPHGGFPFNLGVIGLILIPVVIVGYLLIGVGVQFVKGARGIELFPHLYFWKSLPGLIWDGVRFLFTCGRSHTRKYGRISADSSVNTSGFDSTAVTTSSVPSSTTKGGYGAI